MARAVGIDVSLMFTVTFSGGCALAGVGAVLGAQLLPIEPFYALRYLVLFLIVVGLGGTGSFRGSFVAAVAQGLIDTAGKYYLPDVSAYLYLRRRHRAAAVAPARTRAGPGQMTGGTQAAPRTARLSGLIPWLLALAAYFVAPGYLSLGTAVLQMVLFTLSLDVALGFAGIITLGHAAFYGAGAYAAGIFAIHVLADPIAGLLAATLLAGRLGIVTGMLILHTRGLTMMMLTLAIAAMAAEFANQARGLTGGDDGLTGIHLSPLLGLFRWRHRQTSSAPRCSWRHRHPTSSPEFTSSSTAVLRSDTPIRGKERSCRSPMRNRRCSTAATAVPGRRRWSCCLSTGEALGAERLVDTNNVVGTVGSATPFVRDFALKAGGFDAVFSEFNLDSDEVIGDYLLSEADVLGCADFDDAIGVNGWPIEAHVPGDVLLKFPPIPGSRGFNQLPYRMIVPRKIENLFVAGRCASMTHEGQSAARVSGGCFVMGEAAGTAANLALAAGVAPRAVDVAALQHALEGNGVYLGRTW